MKKGEVISIKTTVNAPVEKVWECYTGEAHIIHWNFAADTWCCPKAVNNLEEGGSFNYRMKAKDGSFGFDLMGIYDDINENESLHYHLDDGRKVEVQFIPNGYESVDVRQSFEAEKINTAEQQRQGWQAILDNFKKYVESL